MFTRLRSFWHALWKRSENDRDLDDEVRFHVESRAEDLIRTGIPRGEARRRARLEFGALDKAKEACRESRRVNWAEDFLNDVRFSFRVLRKSAGFTTVAVLTLSLGICASVAIFAFVDAALIKPLPYRDPNRLVAVYERHTMIPHSNLSYLDYLDWKRLNTSFASFDVWNTTGFLLTTPSGAEAVSGVRVTADFFRTLGVSPALGRDFAPGDDQPSAAKYVLLTYPAWQKRFGGNSDALGRTVLLSGDAYTIIGVLPRDFQFALRGIAEFWTTLRPDRSCEQRRSCHDIFGVARLKDGVSAPAALAELASIAKQLENAYPDSNRGQGAAIIPFSEAVVGNVRPILLLLLTGAGLLLLIACLNVAGLLLSRSVSRSREFAIRTALGATSSRLIRQFTTEGLVLVISSAGIGILVGAWTIRALFALIPKDMMINMPYLQGVGLNFRVLTFVIGVSALALGVFALVPLSRASRSDLGDGFAEGNRFASSANWRRFGSHFVVVELALAMVLLVGAGLLAKSLYRMLRVDLGFQPDHLASLTLDADSPRYGTAPQMLALIREVNRRAGSIPGVESVGLATDLVLNGNGDTTQFRIVDRPYHGEHNDANERQVSPAYFATLHARILRGRTFAENEDASKRRVCIINQTLASKYFGSEDPTGKVIGDNILSPDSIEEIIGVVDDIHEGRLDEQTWPAIYESIYQDPNTYYSVVVRASQDPASVLPALDRTIREISPDIGTKYQDTMESRIEDSPSTYLHRSSARLVTGFAAVALLLGVIGLYGVIAYSVNQRTREIGIRIALGAQRRAVYQLILREAGRLTAFGIIAGIACSAAASALLRTILFGTSAWDVPTFAAVTATLAVASLLASYVPARRATRVDPVIALRHE